MPSSGSSIIQVARVDGEIYSTASPYSHSLPLPEWPSRTSNILNPHTAKYETMNQFRWVSNDLLHMMFVQTSKPFYGHLFDRLALPDNSIPIKAASHPQVWGLDAKLLEDWITLERNLRAVLSACLHISTAPLPKLWRPWSYPKRFGYQRTHSTYRKAAIAAIRSRDAFVPLMAAVSFGLYLMQWQQKRCKDFEWRTLVMEKAHVHAQWLAYVEDVVFDPETTRIGGIIDYTTCQFSAFLPDLIRYFPCMPLYINWGAERPLHVPSYLPVPASAVFNEFNASPQLPPAEVPAAATVTGDSSPSIEMICQNFPPVEKYSSQRAGEDWKSFFARRDAENAKRAEKETEKARQERQRRIKSAEKQAVPGRNDAKVFYWDDEDGFLIRRTAGRGHYDLHWNRFGEKQRRYDSFRNEWDLCKVLDPQDHPTDMNDSDDDSDGEDFYASLDDDDDDEVLYNEGPYSSTADLERIHEIEPEYTTVPVESHDDALDDIAYYRFGFINPVSTVPCPSTIPEMHHVCKFAGVLKDAAVSRVVRDAMVKFFGYLLEAKGIHDIPCKLYDLRQHNADVHRPAAVIIRKKVLNGRLWYILSNRQTDAPPVFTILLASAASVVEILRREWGPRLIDIAEKLIQRGIPFHAALQDSQHHLQRSSLQPCYGLLGYRPANYEPDRLEFATYQALCRNFLTSQRGRAALLAGGILGRIAKDFISNDEVYPGPSHDVFKTGLSFVADGEAAPTFWDDALTDDEINLLCGVYKVDTGRGKGDESQLSLISWFPKPVAWEASGLNIGFWSSDCESWYRGRLKEINSRNPVLRTTNQWRHSIRFLRRSQKVAEANERLAREYLHTVLL